jgi:hypothetical protein
MSRSVRHSPFMGWHANCSEKYDKQHAHRRFRQLNKLRLHADRELIQEYEVYCDEWNGNKDGRRMIDPLTEPHLMRK